MTLARVDLKYIFRQVKWHHITDEKLIKCFSAATEFPSYKYVVGKIPRSQVNLVFNLQGKLIAWVLTVVTKIESSYNLGRIFPSKYTLWPDVTVRPSSEHWAWGRKSKNAKKGGYNTGPSLLNLNTELTRLASSKQITRSYRMRFLWFPQ